MSRAKEKVAKAYADHGIKKAPVEKKQTKRDKREQFVKKQVVEAFSDHAGVVALAYIASICGYQLPDAVVKNQYGGIDQDSTVYNAARRSIYLELRKMLPREILKKAEFYNINDEDIINE